MGDLPQDHWIYGLHHKVQGQHPVVEALSAGGRERILLFPSTDVARLCNNETYTESSCTTPSPTSIWEQADSSRFPCVSMT